MLVANTHLDYDPGVQETSAKLIIDFLNSFIPRIPTVIIGDFNAKPKSPTHERFRKAGFGLVLDGKPITTYHHFEGRSTGQHIDWILFKGGLEPVLEEVVTKDFNGAFPSDHYPVRSFFVFPQKENGHDVGLGLGINWREEPRPLSGQKAAP